MRLRPATRAALFVDSCFCLVTAWRRNDRFSPATLQRSDTCQSELPIRHLSITNMQPLRRPAALPCSLPLLRRAKEQRANGGRRPQRPGNQSRSRAFLEVPRQFTLENRRLPLAWPQSSGKHRNSHVSLNPLSATFVAPRNRKNFRPCAEPVDDVSSLWKPEEN